MREEHLYINALVRSRVLSVNLEARGKCLLGGSLSFARSDYLSFLADVNFTTVRPRVFKTLGLTSAPQKWSSS